MCSYYRPGAVLGHLDVYGVYMRLGVDIPESKYDGFYPLARVPMVKLNDAGERELAIADWGLLPHFFKPGGKHKTRKSFQRMCYNARSETIDMKPSYRAAFKKRRGLMPVTEFREEGFMFHLEDKRPFATAAIWETWQGPDEPETVLSVSMVTTAPNELLASVGHDRMPVLLTTDAEMARWMDPEIVERGPLEELFRPYDSKVLRHYPYAKADEA